MDKQQQNLSQLINQESAKPLFTAMDSSVKSHQLTSKY